MVRLLGVISLAVVIPLLLLAVGASIIGRGMQTEIVTVATTPRYAVADDVLFRLVDLNRRLPVNVPVPVDNISDINLTSGHDALILTRMITQDFSHYGLHYFDVLSGNLRSLINHDAPGRVSVYQQSANIFQNFSPVFSPDGTMIAFVDPIEQTVNVYNLETGTTVLRQEMQYTTQFVPFGWSPDSTQLAYRELAGALVVLSVDGSSVREYDVGSGQPMWSRDGRWILMMRGGGAERAPIRIIDAGTGETHPHIEGVSGTSATWSCDNQWLSYAVSENGTLEVHLLNLETGNIYDPHNRTALSGINIGYFYWLPDCHRMILTGSREYRQVSQVMVPPLMFFVLDASSQAIHLLTDNGGFVGNIEDGAIYYYENVTANQKNALYRLNEQSNQAEWIADIPAINSWLGILDPARAVFVDYNTWELKLLDFQTGVTHSLLPGGEPVHSYVTWETG